MAKYIAVHTLIKSPDDVNKAFAELSPKFAKAQAAGKNPANCIKTWNPLPHGRTTTCSVCGKPTNLKIS